MATVILKATEKCNSNCYYCDVVFKEETGSSMPLEILETVFIRTNEYLKAFPDEKIQILWHGGEPLLLGPEYFQASFEIQEKYCPETKGRIHHSIQTNLTCFSENFVNVFQKLGINSVGTSYDPEPHIRGPGKEIDSDWYNRKFMKGISLLERNNIGWGLIYVVTKKSIVKALDVFVFLTNIRLSGGFNMNPVLIYDEKRKDIAITPDEYIKFLGDIFPYWWKYRYRFPEVEPFKSLVNNIIQGEISLGCVDSGSCTYHHINIAPDGETSQCGRSADWNLLQYGNIMDKTFDEILHDSKRDELEQRNRILFETECKGCRFWKLCHGGCPLDSYSKYKSFMHKSEWCEAKKGFIANHFEPVTGVKFKPEHYPYD